MQQDVACSSFLAAVSYSTLEAAHLGGYSAPGSNGPQRKREDSHPSHRLTSHFGSTLLSKRRQWIKIAGTGLTDIIIIIIIIINSSQHNYNHNPCLTNTVHAKA